MTPPRTANPLCLIVIVVLLWCAAKARANVTQDLAFAHLKQWEGYSQTVYRDGPGYSVGLGHYLGRKPSKRTYSNTEIQAFFAQDYQIALKACRLNVTNFDSLPTNIQLVALGIAFQCGPAGFRRFERFRAALGQRNYRLASNELINSRWYNQVSPARRQHYIKTLTSSN